MSHKKKHQKEKQLFDSLNLVSMDEKGDSVWIGQGGCRYVFCKLKSSEGRPVAKVIRDGKFLTGLFKTKERGIYSGDILLGSAKGTEKTKRYLYVEFINKEQINISIFV